MDPIRCLGYADLIEETKNGESTYYLDVNLTLTSPSDNTPVNTRLRLPISQSHYKDMLAQMKEMQTRSKIRTTSLIIKESNLELILV